MASNDATKTNITKQRRGPGGKLLPSVRDTPIKPVVDAINATFRAIREQHPEIPNAVLVIGASGRKSRSTLALGHFAPNSWESKDGKHEIAMSGEVLRQGAAGVLETLLHESAHLLADTREIKDTSRQGRWHNVKFKALANELGLVVPESDPSIGWSNTRLTDETKKVYKSELSELGKALKLYRLPVPEKVTKKVTTKVECACRSITLADSFLKKGNIECVECGVVFRPVESDDDFEGDYEDHPDSIGDHGV